ncbi:MAG: hypothetical protein IJ403_03460 [Oscillospiraceae bacterium]|nr:hypothetical protein [Oscillospiraceae bacterium]
MWFFYIMGLVIGLIIDYMIAKKFSEIAEEKGHEGTEYFWYTFVFGVVGMLMVVALPDVYTRKKATAKEQENNKKIVLAPTAPVVPADSHATHIWRCDGCGKMRSQTPCEHCGKQ